MNEEEPTSDDERRLTYIVVQALPPGWTREGFHHPDCKCGVRVHGGGFVAAGPDVNDVTAAIVLISHMWERGGQAYSDYVAGKLSALSTRLGSRESVEMLRDHLRATATTLLLEDRVRVFVEGEDQDGRIPEELLELLRFLKETSP